MAKEPEVAGRFTSTRISVTIDQRPYPITNMNPFEVLIGGAPDWITVRQKIDFTFHLQVGGRDVVLPTYGIVLKNDASGLEIRYQAPNDRWRDLLTKMVKEEYA